METLRENVQWAFVLLWRLLQLCIRGVFDIPLSFTEVGRSEGNPVGGVVTVDANAAIHLEDDDARNDRICRVLTTHAVLYGICFNAYRLLKTHRSGLVSVEIIVQPCISHRVRT